MSAKCLVFKSMCVQIETHTDITPSAFMIEALQSQLLGVMCLQAQSTVKSTLESLVYSWSMHNKVNFNTSSVFRFETQCRKGWLSFLHVWVTIQWDTNAICMCQHSIWWVLCIQGRSTTQSPLMTHVYSCLKHNVIIVPSVNDVCTKVSLPLQLGKT